MNTACSELGGWGSNTFTAFAKVVDSPRQSMWSTPQSTVTHTSNNHVVVILGFGAREVGRWPMDLSATPTTTVVVILAFGAWEVGRWTRRT